MEKEKAFELASQYMESANTLCVMSDGAVYINNDIEKMKAHATELGKEIFVFKEDVNAVVSEVEVKKTSKKNK